MNIEAIELSRPLSIKEFMDCLGIMPLFEQGVVGWVILAGALLWDRSWGEMPTAIHPVVWMGIPIRWVKTQGLKKFNKGWHQYLFGAAASFILPIFFAILSGLLLVGAREGGSLGLEIFLGTFLLKSSFARKSLGQAGSRVRDSLYRASLGEPQGLEQARWALRSLCSRDPRNLNPRQIAGAAVSSLAENLSDSVVAPLCFYLVAGIPGAIFYRVVNTMDAILGYRGPLEFLGKAAARLDDLLNWIPARLTSIFLLIATPPNQWVHVTRVIFRYARTTPSPNGGWPMSAMAGALQITLEKVGVYCLRGEKIDGRQGLDKPDWRCIDQAWALAQRGIWLFLGAGLLLMSILMKWR